VGEIVARVDPLLAIPAVGDEGSVLGRAVVEDGDVEQRYAWRVVLSCTPSDYAGFGAREIRLPAA
jgi:hypothetical protein